MQLFSFLEAMQISTGIALQIPVLEIVKIAVWLSLLKMLKKIHDFQVATAVETKLQLEMKLKKQWENDLVVFLAPHGSVWHSSAECPGLARAGRVSSRRFCLVCAG